MSASPVRHHPVAAARWGCPLLLNTTSALTPPASVRFRGSPAFAVDTGNGLKDLPASVAALSSLRTLRLSDNALTALPKELALLPSLTEVHVDGNTGLGSSDRVVDALRHRPETTVVFGDAGDDSRRRQEEASISTDR